MIFVEMREGVIVIKQQNSDNSDDEEHGASKLETTTCANMINS